MKAQKLKEFRKKILRLLKGVISMAKRGGDNL